MMTPFIRAIKTSYVPPHYRKCLLLFHRVIKPYFHGVYGSVLQSVSFLTRPIGPLFFLSGDGKVAIGFLFLRRLRKHSTVVLERNVVLLIIEKATHDSHLKWLVLSFKLEYELKISHILPLKVKICGIRYCIWPLQKNEHCVRLIFASFPFGLFDFKKQWSTARLSRRVWIWKAKENVETTFIFKHLEDECMLFSFRFWGSWPFPYSLFPDTPDEEQQGRLPGDCL